MPRKDSAPASGAGRAELETVRAELAAVRSELAALRQDLELWRSRAVDGWSVTASQQETSGRGRDAATLAHELDRMESSLSWRLTAPLRTVGLSGPLRAVRRMVRPR